MRRTETKEISGTKYKARQMGAFDAAKYWPQMMKFLGPDFLALIGAVGDSTEVLENPKIMSQIFTTLTDNAQEGEMMVIYHIIRCCEVCIIEEGEAVKAYEDLDLYFPNPYTAFPIAVWAASMSFTKPSKGNP